jgi:ribosomal protein S18 acetylase RimI-like enzyme
MANAWPAQSEETVGGWRYRWTGGLTRRANSALVLGDGDPAALVQHAEAFYRERGASTLLRVSTASAPTGLASYLGSLGYRSTARTLVQVADTSEVVARARPAFELEVTDAPTTEWLDLYWSVGVLRCRDNAAQSVYGDVLLAPPLPTVFVAARSGSEVVGVGQMVIEQGWAGVQCMATGPDHRRQGVASAVLHGFGAAAAERGVQSMYLAAMADNEAATGLYSSAGFTTAHEYSYFTDARE